ncbi:hypothetical protein MKW98_009185, partial [Papaver atlanticum]
GQLEELKVEKCKVYLKNKGLRLTVKKDVLIEQIREHLGVINGSGEQKCPVSSFVYNCKGVLLALHLELELLQVVFGKKAMVLLSSNTHLRLKY